MGLQELLDGFGAYSLNGIDSKDVQISGLALDSRKVVSGTVFFALSGSSQHGLAHLQQSIDNGACTVLVDPVGLGGDSAPGQPVSIPMIAVANLAEKLGDIAARYYGYPSRFMDVIGITGTNGKTSCSQFLGQMLDDCGIIGTLGWGEPGKLNKTLNTTPDALSVQQMLATLLKDKKQAVAMEVSSHGLEQGRVNGVQFKGAVFTNISRDHLDYHGTMEAYLQAKLALLKKQGLAFVVVNLDDVYCGQIISAIPEKVAVWGISAKGNTLDSGKNINAENILNKGEGIEFDVCFDTNAQHIFVPLYGDFNVENVLCVLAVMLALGISLADAAERLKSLKPVAGRMENFGGAGQPLVFVDYAHTPDALDKVLSSLRKHVHQDLWAVFGCGGNRDKGKRPQMGHIAEQAADHVIVTDDNPRFEDGMAIVNDILSGCSTSISSVVSKVEVIRDRAQAIRSAIANADNNDCILIAGKGHEDYQEINGLQLPFSDKDIVIEALTTRAG